MNDFGKMVKKQRLKLKKSQSVLANEIGITQPFLAEIENGRKKPSFEVAYKLCSELEIPFLAEIKNGRKKSTIHIGEAIRHFRYKRGMTVKALADKVGLTSPAISQYERGLRTPNGLILGKIEDALDIRNSDLYEYIENNFSDSSPEFIDKSTQIKSDARAKHNALKEQLKFVIDFLRLLECDIHYHENYSVVENSQFMVGFSVLITKDKIVYNMDHTQFDALRSYLFEYIKPYFLYKEVSHDL